MRHRRLLRQRAPCPGDRRADDGGAAPARTRCRARRVLGPRSRAHRRRRAERAAPYAAVDHRSAPRSRPADGQRRAATSGSRYNGEVYDWAADAETLRDGRLPLPHALRHRIHPARVRALGHRLRARGCAACSRSRSVDLDAPRGLRRARPPGPEAASSTRIAPTASRSRRRCARCCRGCRATRAVSRPRASTPISRTGRSRRRARSSRTSSRLPPAHYLHYDLAQRHARDARVLAARSRRPSRGCRRSTRRSGCARSPIGRSASSCRRASIRRALACRLAAMGFNRLQIVHRRVSRHAVRRKRGGAHHRAAAGLSQSRDRHSRRASPTISRASSPISTSRSPIRPACRRGTSRARRRGT